jgi:hypothetical protein
MSLSDEKYQYAGSFFDQESFDRVDFDSMWFQNVFPYPVENYKIVKIENMSKDSYQACLLINEYPTLIQFKLINEKYKITYVDVDFTSDF